jgi:chemotaxis methyl-accepting protein methylase
MTKPTSAISGRSRRAVRPSTTDGRSPVAPATFPIVGIGASAGGLEAVDQFLAQVPQRSGMAFVIVQHLDPTQPGLMPELLQRTTSMKVVQVKDRMRVRPDGVYVIPPNKNMSLLRGVLHLFEPAEPRGLRLPIDFFFRSLAQDQQDRSIGVILSGMGSDGTLGLRAIKETAGLALVQDPTTAKFDGMPTSAITAGWADIVAPAPELPARLVSYLARTPSMARIEAKLDVQARSSLEKAVILLRARTGHDFSLYKQNTLHRRITRRMGIHQIDTMAKYVRYLQESTQELDLLFKELLIGVTSFFRDRPAWEQLQNAVLPALLAQLPPGRPLRAWVPGCSTGEEAYSLAMACREAVARHAAKIPRTIQIFATDLDRDAIDHARQGLYPETAIADLEPDLVARYFVQEERGWRIRQEIREMVIFAPQNLIRDPPFTKLDLLTCRNLLIYLIPAAQKKLTRVFHHSLNPGGILFLGSAETIGDATDLFSPVHDRSRIFRRLESVGSALAIEFPSSFSTHSGAGAEAHPPAKRSPSLQSVADQLILQHYAPAAVMVNEGGDIVYVSGRTGKYLEPAAGKANWNLFAMAREGLRHELASAFRRALRRRGPVTLPGLTVGGAKGDESVNITLHRVDEAGPLQGFVVVLFTPAPPAAPVARRLPKSQASRARLAQLEYELAQVRAECRTSQEEMQTSQEELRSMNEELQSTNEELQSANEELTTSREEMQSLNEELQTLNAELQAKLDELSRSGDDMKNLLNSTDIAILFLDRELKVRRFTAQTTSIIKLIPGDVGRPLTDLVSELQYPELVADVRQVLHTLQATERPIAASRDRWFTVRIMPYRTMGDQVDGVVMTFADITVAKTLEATLRCQQAELERHIAARPATPSSPPVGKGKR